MKTKIIFSSIVIVSILLIIFIINTSETYAATTITITSPLDIESWTLNPGQLNTTTGNLHIKVITDVSATWTISASDSNPETLGFMTQYDSGYQTGIKLGSAMQIQSEQTVTLPAGGTIISGNGPVDADRTITFKQDVTWTDVPASYKIVVTFTGTTTP